MSSSSCCFAVNAKQTTCWASCKSSVLLRVWLDADSRCRDFIEVQPQSQSLNGFSGNEGGKERDVCLISRQRFESARVCLWVCSDVVYIEENTVLSSVFCPLMNSTKNKYINILKYFLGYVFIKRGYWYLLYEFSLVME